MNLKSLFNYYNMVYMITVMAVLFDTMPPGG